MGACAADFFSRPLVSRADFLAIDGKRLYLVGSSLKDLGWKCFAFTELDAGEIPNHRVRIHPNPKSPRTSSGCTRTSQTGFRVTNSRHKIVK